jgi:RND family efflux transporter MFP subunit
MIPAFAFVHAAPAFGLRRLAIVTGIALAAGAAACGGGGPAAGNQAAAAGPPAMPVEINTLALRPVEDTGEFVGAIKSRQSTTVQPQVEGFLTRILVKSGDRVKAGDVLMEVDANSQQSVVAALRSVRIAREADATWATAQVGRAKSLLAAGAMSQQEYEQALAAQKSADAQLQAIDDQIKQQQNELGYYKVTASTNGIVGDVPVRQGDRVTKTTVLTTLETNAGFELYVSVPVQLAPRLHLGLPVRLLDEAGKVSATEQITFISPSVDDATQSVLVKASLSGDTSRFRPDQFVRVSIVWANTPGLTIPVVAVQRVAGQYFVFVMEDTPKGTVARQRPVTLGAIVGNDYLVLGGVKAGDRVIVGGTQKIFFDGAPVRAGGAGPGGAGTAPGGR